jgi:hypothetical protein
MQSLMLARFSHSLRARGVAGTARSAGRVAITSLRRAHLWQHLEVPWAMLRTPHHAADWLHDRVSAEGPAQQRLPWIAWPCVDFLNRYLRPEHRVFEWGGGGSTIFFLARGCRVTTVESSAEWVERIESQVHRLGGDARDRWELRYVPIVDNADPGVDDYVRQVEIGSPWDLVMVDGWARLTCLRRGQQHVTSGGLLLLDNADQKQFENVPRELGAWQRRAFRGLGVARSWVTQTDAYIKPAQLA